MIILYHVEVLNVTPAPEGIDMEQAAFFDLGHTGMYAVRRAQL